MVELPKDTIYHYESKDGMSVTITMTELVRCKDCKYHTAYNECTCPQWDINDYDYPVTYDDGFCKWGERKDGGENG